MTIVFFSFEHRNYPLNHGFDHFFGFNGGGKHYLIHNAKAEEAFRKAMRIHAPDVLASYYVKRGPLYDDLSEEDQEGFATELFGERARQFMADCPENKPFFVQLSFNAVHDQTYHLPGDYLEKNGLKGHPNWDPSKQTFDDFVNETLLPEATEARDWYLGQLHYLDQELGRLLDFLEKRDLLKNTIIIYTSDNGGSLVNAANNLPLRGGKFTTYEGGIRVPFIISWPQHILKGTSSVPVSHLDLAPTLMTLTNTPTNTQFDGVDLTPLLTGQREHLEPRQLFWDVGRSWAVRDGKWKLRISSRAAMRNIYRDKDREYDPPGIYLHDLETDIGETINLVDDHPDVAARLTMQHRQWLQNVLTEPSQPQHSENPGNH